MSDTLANRAYLALGSNISPEVNLPSAARLLADFGSVVAVSGVWERIRLLQAAGPVWTIMDSPLPVPAW